MLSGGNLDRAEGLWEEVGADMHASTAAEAVKIAAADESERPQPRRTIKRRKKVAPQPVEAEQLQPAVG